MRKSGTLSSDVSCKELAANTTRFSGAEIASIVRAATSYALERQVYKETSIYKVHFDTNYFSFVKKLSHRKGLRIGKLLDV